jgi:molybdenum cofactor cytidylyltransferase
MGRPKLLLPLGDTSVLGHLLATLAGVPGVCPFVLVRPDDPQLSSEALRGGATVVCPETPPPEMRVSVERLIRAVEERHAPAADDGWLLIPGDHPLVKPGTLKRLIDVWSTDRTRIVLPEHAGRRGHPTILPWRHAADVKTLPVGVGVNHLLRRHADLVTTVPVDDPCVTLDLDTPADYERALQTLLAERGTADAG